MITLLKSILQNDSKVKHQIHTIKEPSVEDQYQQQYQHQFDSELNTCQFQSRVRASISFLHITKNITKD